jgi:hypothetical protein
VLLAALGWDSIGKGARSLCDHLNDLWSMHQRMAHEFPVGTVVVDSSAGAAAPSAPSASASRSGFTGGILIFEHGLRSRGGVRAMMQIEYVTPRSWHGEHLAVTIFEPGGMTRWSRHHGPDVAFDLGGSVADGSIGRIFAGQPDPNDPSHFTIEFEQNGRRSSWEGWLIDLPALSSSGCRVGLKMSNQSGATTMATP